MKPNRAKTKRRQLRRYKITQGCHCSEATGGTRHCRLAALVTRGLRVGGVGTDGAIITKVIRVVILTLSIFIGVELDDRRRPVERSRAENRELAMADRGMNS